jgi:hypothetical protein
MGEDKSKPKPLAIPIAFLTEPQPRWLKGEVVASITKRFARTIDPKHFPTSSMVLVVEVARRADGLLAWEGVVGTRNPPGGPVHGRDLIECVDAICAEAERWVQAVIDQGVI